MRCDLHIHTRYSYDSSASPKEMIEAAIEKGIDCLAITDHNEIKGSLEGLEYAKGKPILIIPGIEVKSKEGDILALNIKEIIPKDLSAKETIKKIKEGGGLAILPHPFGWFCSFKGNLEELIKDVNGVEVLNASLFGGNERALALAQKYNLPFTCGSDAHFPNFIDRTFLEILGENLSIEDVLEKIKNKEAKICGKEATFLEKIIDHGKRNLVKLKMFKLRV